MDENVANQNQPEAELDAQKPAQYENEFAPHNLYLLKSKSPTRRASMCIAMRFMLFAKLFLASLSNGAPSFFFFAVFSIALFPPVLGLYDPATDSAPVQTKKKTAKVSAEVFSLFVFFFFSSPSDSRPAEAAKGGVVGQCAGYELFPHPRIHAG